MSHESCVLLTIVILHILIIGAVIKTFEGGDGAIFLESLGCSGTESILIECSHPLINVHNCDHSDDAGVLCNCELLTLSACTVGLR